MTQRRRILTNAIALYALQATNMLVPLLVVPYLLRVIGIDGYGAMAYTASVVQLLVTLTSFSFNYTATQVVSTNRDDPTRLSEVLTTVTLARVGLAVGSSALLTVLVLVVPTFRQHATLFVVQLTMVLGDVLFPQWLFLGMQRMVLVTAINVASRTATLALTVLLVREPEDVVMAAGLQAGHYVVVGALAQIVTFRVLGVRYRWSNIDWPRAGRMLRDSAAVFVGTLSSHVYSKGSLVVLGFFVTTTALGHFAVAQRVAGLISTLVAPMTQSLYPHVCSLSDNGPGEELAALRRRSVGLTILGVLLALVALNIGAPWVVRLLTGEYIPELVQLLRLFSPLILATAINVVLNIFVMAMKRYTEMRRMYAVAAAIFLTTGPALTYFFAAEGMAVCILLVEGYVSLQSWLITTPTSERTPRAPVAS